MRAVVLQPMYLPWMGYFGLIEQADTFVFYDDVQFVRDSWQRRNKIRVPEHDGDFRWLTVPVEKDFGQRINEVEIKYGEDDWREEHWEEIRRAYGDESVPYGPESAEYFDAFADEVRGVYDERWERLVDLDTAIIEHVTDLLDLDRPEFVFSSDLEAGGEKTERLIAVLEEIGAEEYVSGPAARDYLEIEPFRDAGIDLYWHEFDHPEYAQQYDCFVSHLSVIDALFNVGEGAADLIRSAEETALEKDARLDE